MPVTITAFANSPDRGRGLARDMRVRWALEEVGEPYEVRLVTFEEMRTPEYRTLQPFGQIPAYQEDGLTLFETGAIVLHIAGRHPGLLPEDADARARAIAWMFAALNTVEPPLVAAESVALMERDKPWFDDRLAAAEVRARRPLADLSARLADAEWLEGGFSAGDLMMAAVLFRKRSALDGFPNLETYVARAEARPAFQRAFAAQRAVFEEGQRGGDAG